MKTAKCSICEKEFEKRTNSKYCSPECKGKALLENQHKFNRSDYGKKYHKRYVELRRDVFNNWKKEHPDIYELSMKKIRGE
jgi:hypothetical protein